MPSALILKIHTISVTVFLVFYLLKTFFLLLGKDTVLDTFSKNTRITEMVFSALFLITGIWLIVITGGIKTLQIVKLLLVFASIPLAVTGFKKKKKILASLSFLMLIGAYGLAEASRSKPYPIKHASASESSPGKYLFENNCTQCHGPDGKKMYHEAADLSLSVKDASMMAAIIRNGSNKKMPAYGELLSEEEIHAVAEYVYTLRSN